MVTSRQGQTSWLAPTVRRQPADGALLPYWIGAWRSSRDALLDPAFAARLPFALLLALALALIWYTATPGAHAEAAQPRAFRLRRRGRIPLDYARALADGALLAMIASLGLLQLGHETTPELVQLSAVALALYGLGPRPRCRAAAWRRRSRSPCSRRAAPGDRDAARRRSPALVTAAPPGARRCGGGRLDRRRRAARRRRGHAWAWANARRLWVRGSSSAWRAPDRLVPLAGLAAGAVDALALAPPLSAPHVRARWRARRADRR